MPKEHRCSLPLHDLSTGPVVQQVERIIQAAIGLGASDVHIEPFEQRLRVRYRIDGVLQHAGDLSVMQRDAVVSRLKVLASLDIAEKRRPQDGRIRAEHKIGDGSRRGGNFRASEDLHTRMGGSLANGTGVRERSVEFRSVDLRVSILPTHFGEKVVMRVLDRSALQLDLAAIGFDPEQLAAFRRAVEASHGMVLVTGPTGSGKTTTLYAALSSLATESVNVTTVEDPIEYDVEGVNQTQARPDIGFSFAEALRSFLRQDPDIIMVGEIRDTETAEVAIRAALTGHLVLSTLHTNDASSTVTRLIDMGVDAYLVAASVRAAVAQRLMRVICSSCKEALDASERSRIPQWFRGSLEEMGSDVVLYRGVGCGACGGTGYKGRTAVFEVMPMSEPIAEAIVRGASAQEIRRMAREEGMKTLGEVAVSKMLSGATTLDEVVRIVSA